MKAGSVGSTPNGVTIEKKNPSHPLHMLLREVGNTVFVVNTTVVGLDAVENDHPKPESLDISWEPNDRKIAARKARKFLLESTLVRVSEAINQFVIALSRLPRFSDVRKNWNSRTSAAEKLSAIAAAALKDDDYLIPAVVLLIHWRNRIVHTNSNATLKHDERSILLNAEDTIVERYKGLKISELLRHFGDQRLTLKDASSLIAMTINLARKIDATIQEDLGKEDLDSWLEYYGIFPILKKIKSETKPEKLPTSICHLFKTKAPKLLASYTKHYGK